MNFLLEIKFINILINIMNNSSIEITSASDNFHSFTFSTKDFVFQAINLALSSYIFVAVLVYQFKHKEKKRKPREAIILNSVCFFNTLCPFVTVVKDIPILYLKYKSNGFCSPIVNFAGGGTYFLGLSSAFWMLWYRQRKLYSSPVMKMYTFKGIDVINYLLLVCYLLLVVAITVAFLYETDWVQVNNTCVQTFAGKINILAMTVCYCVLTVVFQVTLFMFIAYPIVYCMLRKKKNIEAGLKKMLKRLLICTLGCCVSSLQINVFILLVERNKIFLYWPSFAGLDLIITAVCVVGTFDNWKERLFPFRSKVVERLPNFLERRSTKYSESKTRQTSVK